MPEIDGEPISDSFNARIVAEFRANHGRVGGPFEGAPMILIHHRGAKTGTERVSPALYYKLDGGWAVFASKAGAPTDPDWYHNLLAHPDGTIEVGDDTIDVVARVAEGDERARIRDAWHQTLPLIDEYEAAAATTGRQIPIVIFEPAAKG